MVKSSGLYKECLLKCLSLFAQKVFFREEDKIQGLLLRGERGGVAKADTVPEVLWRKKGKVLGLLPQGERGSRS
jgi:hypothetical protein